MFSITLKRSAATVGVVAGLLVAAAPASAQILDGPIMWDTPRAYNTWGAAGTETGNPERTGSLNASGGWDPTSALNSRGIALHAVATTIVGGLVPGGAIVSA